MSAPCCHCGSLERYANGNCKPCHRRAVTESRRRHPDAYHARQVRYMTELSSPSRLAEKRRLKQITSAPQGAVARALKRGELIRPSECEECGRGGVIHAAHSDYARPLDVRWLCRRCHALWDRSDPKTRRLR